MFALCQLAETLLRARRPTKRAAIPTSSAQLPAKPVLEQPVPTGTQ
jgi:hypothetical protein